MLLSQSELLQNRLTIRLPLEIRPANTAEHRGYIIQFLLGLRAEETTVTLEGHTIQQDEMNAIH